jgi:hypothetical protein
MALVAGSLNLEGNFTSQESLAAYMDQALPVTPEFAKKERREFLIAISTGIINYLKARDGDSFKITVGGAHSGNHTATLEIL